MDHNPAYGSHNVMTHMCIEGACALWQFPINGNCHQGSEHLSASEVCWADQQGKWKSSPLSLDSAELQDYRGCTLLNLGIIWCTSPSCATFPFLTWKFPSQWNLNQC